MNTEQKHYRHQYVIGDLQGCFGAFNELLSALNFDETQDKLWLAGDIVARGEDSLATLREAKRLSDIDALSTVLGNHDITLIATWRGVLTPKQKIRRYRFLKHLTVMSCLTGFDSSHFWYFQMTGPY